MCRLENCPRIHLFHFTFLMEGGGGGGGGGGGIFSGRKRYFQEKMRRGRGVISVKKSRQRKKSGQSFFSWI